jgi:ABC-2 type transport system ATP-binding protein
MADAAVEVHELVVRYGDLVAVAGVSFTAQAGEVTAILGPNGAGKTSTIEVCEGFREAFSGTVKVLGMRPDRDQQQLSARMGVMLQDGGCSPSARVGDTVALYCALYDRGVRADDLIDLVGLGDRRRSTWRRLSGGERQRLNLALALAAKPEVAFLDEPTSGVDVTGRALIREIVRNLTNDGCAVVLATHELDEAERMADRAVIIDHGVVVANGTLAELRAGHDEIRFRSSDALELQALADHLGLAVDQLPLGEYRIAAASTPELLNALTGWLSANGLPLDDLRAGAQRLEDVFWRLTGHREEGS